MSFALAFNVPEIISFLIFILTGDLTVRDALVIYVTLVALTI